MDYAYLHLKMQKTLFTGILFLFTCFTAISQVSSQQDSLMRDSIEQEESFLRVRIAPRVAVLEDIQLGIDTFYKSDTTFKNFHRFNPVYKNYLGVQDLGFMGSAYKSQLFRREKDIGFQVGENAYNHFTRTADETIFYEAQVPFTNFYYNQGKEGLLNLSAFHTQNILPNWNIAADYRSFKSDGIYLRQSQKIKNTQVSSKYSTLNGRYLLATSLNWNNFTFYENGGITSDSLFESASNLNKNVPINLQAAQNTIKSREHRLYHHLKLGPTRSKIRDKDTVDYVKHRAILFHQMDWNRSAYFYQDDNLADDFYHTPYFLDSTSTADSTTYNKFKNKVGIGVPFSLSNLSGGLRGYGMHEIIHIYQGDSSFANGNNTGIGGDLNISRKGSLIQNLEAELHYIFQGMNAQDISFKAKSNLYKDSTYTLLAKANYNRLEANFVQNTMYSNHYLWNNNFEKEGHLNYGLSLSRKSKKVFAKVSIEQNILSNYIYYDTAAQAKQSNSSSVSIGDIGLSLNFHLGNFIFNNEVHFQSTNESSIIHLPTIVSSHQFYYQRYAFKDVLKFQLGLELFYNNSYLSDKYNPATRQFYLQEEVETGNYPLMNAFLNLQIKTMKIFFELEHFNQGLSGKRYYGTAHQPLTPRRFVLGVGWDLYY